MVALVGLGCVDPTDREPDSDESEEEASSEMGTVTLTIEGMDVDNGTLVNRWFESDLSLTSALYSEDEQTTTLFLGLVHSEGDGLSIESAEVAVELFFPRLSELPPDSDGLEFGAPADSQMLAAFVITEEGATQERVFLDELKVTASSVRMSEFDVASTTDQCLELEAQGPCETAVGTVFVEASITGEDGDSGRATLDLSGPVGAFWSRLTDPR